MSSAVIQWLRGLWRFYLEYTQTRLHAATAAAFAIFGLLVFVDPLFAALAIASYVLPPVVMYVLADDPIDEYVRDERPADADESSAEAMLARDASRLAGETTTDGGAGETDRSTPADESRLADERKSVDTDSDHDDGDTDFDSDDGDTDSDSDDGDTDSDRDDGDTDSDSDDGDTDSDSDS
ncbi:hypothetical protein CV102_15065 [Natronococcus pandeyae]|uniref:Uncharacterized protein n=1 Tax=Natronococcus pandeyae TaxID=2055836 RepID=A0A8J8TPP9_9EURY|nr:hypothetical protein [Natronococcus pandeyae]TYL37658.1 hypothetical protein CV102_15065 [Natronococcus pandeyae]